MYLRAKKEAMTSRYRGSIAGIFFVALLAALNSGCSGGGSIGTTNAASGGGSSSGGSGLLTISLSDTSATVDEGATAQITAMVTNDAANRGVTWTVSCPAAACGSVSPNSTASGATITYTPPGSVASNLTVTLTAVSVADATKSASLTITVPALTISLAPLVSDTLQAGGTIPLTATVTNDGASKGVTWTVSCSEAPCGTVSPTTTASGSPTNYTAPITLPANGSTVTFTAASVTDGSKAVSKTLTLLPISVSITPSKATVQAGGTAQFTALVPNDSANKGVAWTVSCSAAPCGSVSPTATANGVATTYTAPATAPTSSLTVTLTATSVTDGTKTASGTITVPASVPPGITVSIAPGSATVPAGGTQQFTATVTNDPNNGGVTWQVFAKLFCNGAFSGKCQPFGEPPIVVLPCSGCGTFSPASTASGAQTTYTAPAHLTPPSKAGYFFFGSPVSVVATSVTNTSASATAGLTLPQISVSVSPGSASVALKGTQQFTATVKNDGSNSGVSWSLTQNGVSCAPGCGTIIPTSTASGAAATYTAPSTGPVTPLVRVIATSVENPLASAGVTMMLTTSTGGLACSAGSGSESLLKGQYAFLLQGDLNNFGEGSIVGSITADGTGKITAGEEDLLGPETLNIDTSASLYAVGPDRRGCLVLTGTGNYLARSFLFSLGSINSSNVATAGHIIAIPEYFSVFLENAIHIPGAAGTIRLQDPTSFTAAQFNGRYALGFIGSDQQKVQNASRRVAIAGTFTADGASAISSGTFDINDLGTITADISSTPEGTFTCCDANGRGSLTLANLRAPNVGFYVINSGDAFVVADDNNFDTIQGVGEAIGIPSAATFGQASLSGSSVLGAAAQSANGPIVDIATVSADGKTAMATNDNVNSGGTFSTGSSLLDYVVASNGRVVTTGTGTPPVLYLYGPNQGFLVGTDPDVTFGILEPQAAEPFSNASFSGAYMLGTENPPANTVTTESGVLTADGFGNAAGTVEQSSPTGLAQDQSLNLTYSFPANGVGNVGGNTTAILISVNRLIFISNASANPTITVVEK